MASTRKGPLKGIVKKLPTVGEQTVEWGVQAVREPVLAAITSDSGGDRKLSGMSNPKPMTVEVRRKSTGTLVEADVFGGPRGRQRAAWFWMNAGTQAGPRLRGASRSGRVVTVNHPGTAAKRTWDRAVDPVIPRIKARFRENVRKATGG